MDEDKTRIQFEVARMLVEHSTKNIETQIDFHVIVAALPNEDASVIEEACFNFENQGYLEASRAIGKAITHIRLYPSFFAEFQPLFGDTNPNIDAIEVARELLAQQKNQISAQELEDVMGWGDRSRFNQAFALVVEHLPHNCLSNQIQSDFPTNYVMLTSEARASLNQFIDIYS